MYDDKLNDYRHVKSHNFLLKSKQNHNKTNKLLYYQDNDWIILCIISAEHFLDSHQSYPV